jgi:hypothetical protein
MIRRPDDFHEIRHRKNAAEWVMWVLFQPIRWFLIGRSKLHDATGDKGGAGDR